jgi:hypothetical protein
MALAALYTQSRLKDPQLPSAHAFIVDHGVRPESTEEAKWVAMRLRSQCETDGTSLSFKVLMFSS